MNPDRRSFIKGLVLSATFPIVVRPTIAELIKTPLELVPPVEAFDDFANKVRLYIEKLYREKCHGRTVDEYMRRAVLNDVAFFLRDEQCSTEDRLQWRVTTNVEQARLHGVILFKRDSWVPFTPSEPIQKLAWSWS
jgi:hypothetical protein